MARSIHVFSWAFVAACCAPLLAHAQTVPTPHASQYGLGLIGAPAAWAAGYNGQGVTVAVADSGIDPAHPAFAGKIDARSRSFVLATHGAAYNVNDITDTDPQSHGTHVAGIIGASGTSNAPGDAFNARLLVLKMIGRCKQKGEDCGAPGIPNASVAALDFFTAQPDVLIYNGSYGPDSGTAQTSWAASLVSTDEAASVLKAVTAGKLVVVANGNDRDTNPVAGQNPNGIALYPFIQPGNANAGVYQDGGNNFNFSALLQQTGQVIAVTAVGQAKNIAYYAQTCGVTASWCVAAPGGDSQADNVTIYSTLPTNRYGDMQGTSMATPMVSGALAVLQQAYPAYGARDLANVLFATAENVGGRPAVNATYGYGLIRLDRGVAGPTTLAANAAIAIAARQVTYWSQPLTTAGAFSLTGPGSLIVAGRTTATGTVSVNGGALGVDGTLTAGAGMTVAQGATLAGFGRIIGNTTINGTLNAGQLPNYADLMANNGGVLPAGTPLTGTSPGTLTFQGDVTLGATATTRANIDGALLVPGGPGTYDKIIVTGADAVFSAGGQLAPVLRDIPGGNNNYSPAAGTEFPFITAQNGAAITGQFAGLTQPSAGLAANTRLDVSYAATSVTINVTPLNFQAVARDRNLDPNARALAQALDTARPAPGVRAKAGAQPLFNDLFDNSAAEDDAEFLDLSGEGLAAHAGAVLSAFGDFSGLLAQRQSYMTGPGAVRLAALENAVVATDAGGAPAPGWTGWAQGYGRWFDTGMEDGIAGSSGDAAGFALGADTMMAPDMLVGGAFGYSRIQTGSADARTDADSYAAALYATWMPGEFVIDGRLAGGIVSGRTVRSVAIAGVTETVSGAPEGWNMLGAARAGYRLSLGSIALEPYAGLTLQAYHQQAFRETGDVGLVFPGQSFSRAQSALGARAGQAFVLWGVHVRPQLDAAWTHDMGDAALLTHTSVFDVPFQIEAARPGRDAALVNAGLSLWQDDHLSLFANYTGEFRANARSQGVSGGLRLAL